MLPGIGGKNSEIVYCAGNDSVFSFLEDVIDEVSELFPSKYIHLGGDGSLEGKLGEVSEMSGSHGGRAYRTYRGVAELFHDSYEQLCKEQG